MCSQRDRQEEVWGGHIWLTPPHTHTHATHIPLLLEKVCGRHEAGVDLEHNIQQEDKAINILRYYKYNQVMLLRHDHFMVLWAWQKWQLFDGFSELFYNECALTCQDGFRLWGSSDFPVKFWNVFLLCLSKSVIMMIMTYGTLSVIHAVHVTFQPELVTQKYFLIHLHRVLLPASQPLHLLFLASTLQTIYPLFSCAWDKRLNQHFLSYQHRGMALQKSLPAHCRDPVQLQHAAGWRSLHRVENHAE